MNSSISNIPARKRYTRPTLVSHGGVKALTLKIGSTSDVGGMQPMP
ncbi:hypothetical protein [Arundinibacter roseus]|nr:hypothetical protein [Arundinibacter roseus]